LIFDRLQQIPVGEVRTLLCTDPREVLSSLELSSTDGSCDFRVAFQQWDTLPDQEKVVNDVLHILAEISFALWPSWYGQENLFHVSAERAFEDRILNLIEIKNLRATQRELCLPWVKAAVNLCQESKLPLLSNFPRALQLGQLALTIQPNNLFLFLSVNDLTPQSYRLLGFARAAVWLARTTCTHVAVLLPVELAQCPELDSILYGAVKVSQLAPLEALEKEEMGGSKSKLSIWPIRGEPHPFSPGEQKLAERLARDLELGALFQFNQSVYTVRGSHYLVDLLWAEGEVVVEVDGYRHHGNSVGFRADRHRDYELLISGYLVLRLPHEDVISDVEIVVEKIRDVVRFRRSQDKSLR